MSSINRIARSALARLPLSFLRTAEMAPKKTDPMKPFPIDAREIEPPWDEVRDATEPFGSLRLKRGLARREGVAISVGRFKTRPRNARWEPDFKLGVQLGRTGLDTDTLATTSWNGFF
jgi:hypothetical protein